MRPHTIEPLVVPDDFKERQKLRCSRIVESTGTGYFEGSKHRCGKNARHKFDGVNLCGLHAGEAALQLLIAEFGVKP